MNIGYHYYTIKTLARKAGFPEEEAQIIAFYSQMVDDFVLSNKAVIDVCPPDFFLKNRLARKIKDKQWEFLPCATGIDFMRTTSHNFERHTLASFHFIPPNSLPQIEKKVVNRFDYRCQKADLSKDMLIVRILKEAVEMVKRERSHKNLMRLGMALHTFADTYAHCNFSGLHGYENHAEIKSAKKHDGKPGVNEADIFFFRELPSIGHGNIGTIPDICTYTISYAIQGSSQREEYQIVSRNNAEFFSECSREILNVLCGITGAPIMNDQQWGKLKQSLIMAQTVEKDERKYLTPSWQKAFPDIKYKYDKKGGFSLSLEVKEIGGMLLDSPARRIAQSALRDAYSCEGNQSRNGYRVHLKIQTPYFFEFNEIAYERVKKVTGEYSSNLL